MSLLHTVNFVWNHPLNEHGRFAALWRLVRWQTAGRVLGLDVLLPLTDGGVLVAGHGMTGATGNYYCGLHEYPDMPFLAHLLRAGDLFLDIGANIGSYTVLAGTRGADVLAVEPVPKTHGMLRRNVAANELSGRVVLHQVALGSEPGTVTMTTDAGPANHVELNAINGAARIEVPMETLDRLVADRDPVAMKLDVEGFEKQVFAGASGVMSNPHMLALIIELNGSGTRYGVEDHEVDRIILDAGFTRVTYDPRTRQMADVPEPNAVGNTLYVRSAARREVAERLRSAEPVSVFGKAV